MDLGFSNFYEEQLGLLDFILYSFSSSINLDLFCSCYHYLLCSENIKFIF